MGGRHRLFARTYWATNTPSPFQVPAALVSRTDPLVIVDPFMAYLPDRVDSNKDQEIRSVLARRGGRPALEIRKILDQHEITPHPVVLQAVREVLKRGTGRIERSQSIEISRART